MKRKTGNQHVPCMHQERQGAREYQSRRQEADREKRQELARLRHEAALDKAGEHVPRHKAADRDRLKGKGLFHCEFPMEREKEIQRRQSEADQENR